MACFQSWIWRGCWNSWIKELVFIGDYRKAITQKYRRENEKNSKKEDKKAKGKELEQIEIKLTLTTLKLIYMKWLVKFYNHITTPEGEQVISSGWCAGGITNALKNSDTCLEPLDPFADIDPIVSEPSVEQDDSNMLQIDEGLIQHLLSEDEANSQFLSFHFIKVFSIKMENLNFHSTAKLNSREIFSNIWTAKFNFAKMQKFRSFCELRNFPPPKISDNKVEVSQATAQTIGSETPSTIVNVRLLLIPALIIVQKNSKLSTC